MRSVYTILENEDLLEEENNLASLLRRVQRAAKNLLKSLNIELALTTDPSTGAPLGTGKISLREPTIEQKKRGDLSVDNLFSIITKVLVKEDWKIWILLGCVDEFDQAKACGEGDD
ncbi:MAG: hypothetical protein WA397_15915 [Roseiarcus sp.]